MSLNVEVDTTKTPVPVGYHVLVAIPKAEHRSSGGIIIPDNSRDREQTASIVGKVIAVGNDAYDNPDKFPNGAWCKPGDWVIFRSYSGTRFNIGEQEFRMINDDTVEGVVADPSVIKRAA